MKKTLLVAFAVVVDSFCLSLLHFEAVMELVEEPRC
jgi:hypothetical protein